jgi:diaminopimelate epimerase
MKAVTLEFEKYQSSGNDFILIDEDRNAGINEATRAALSRALMDRHFSVGADSVLFLKREKSGIRYRILEEGIELEMCGNGLHCAAHYALRSRRANHQVFLTKGDILRSVTRNKQLYTADLGCLQPVGRYLKRPVDDSLQMIGLTELLPGRSAAAILRGLGVNIERGFFVNPSEAHTVFLVKDVTALDLKRVGDYIGGLTSVFPESTNVNLCQRISQQAVRIRTFERGKFKETLACGTGSAASAYVAKAVFGLRGRTLSVLNTGGDLLVQFCGEKILLIGSAVRVFQGSIQVDLTQG